MTICVTATEGNASSRIKSSTLVTHMLFHVRFAVNRRCDLLHLRLGVRHGIATVYTYHAICCVIWCAQRQRAATATEWHTKSHLRFGAKKS
jgi:hypothetical protein